MFNHSKKLCYVVIPKSGSSSMRQWLLNNVFKKPKILTRHPRWISHNIDMGFTKPLGKYGHATVKEIIDYAKENQINIDEYTFFSSFIDPYKKTLLAYFELTNGTLH